MPHLNMCVWMKKHPLGHKYVSFFYDTRDGRFLEVAEGRKDTSVKELYTKTLTTEKNTRVNTICTDMWPTFIKGTTSNLPNALTNTIMQPT